MTENEEFYRLTFSQREGKVPLPEPMRLEHVSKDFRNLVWLAVAKAIGQEMPLGEYEMNVSFRHIVLTILSRFFSGPTTRSVRALLIPCILERKNTRKL